MVVGKVVSLTHRPRSTSQKHYFSVSGTHFCQSLSKLQGLLRPEGLDRDIRIIGLTTLPPSVSQFFRQCGIPNIPQPYSPPRPVTGIAVLLSDFWGAILKWATATTVLLDLLVISYIFLMVHVRLKSFGFYSWCSISVYFSVVEGFFFSLFCSAGRNRTFSGCLA
jgi:hypothetical protein